MNCFYCNCCLRDGNHEKDHFPIPERHGGKQLVDTCLSCHDMKDRFRLDQWDKTWINSIAEQSKDLPRELKIFMAKAMYIVMDSLKNLEKVENEK